ncbi:MAG: AraC family transcriptional regulator, partial [Flavobacterium sp.]
MNKVIFNFHDVVLLITTMLCIFFALLLVVVNSHSSHKLPNYLLAAFLFIHSLIPLNELILWGSVFKLYVRKDAPEFNFIFEFAYYFDGMLLYFYVKSLIFRVFNVSCKDLLHLVPFLIYVIFMILAFYRHPSNIRTDWVRNETFTYSEGHVVMDYCCRLLRASYCLMCLQLIIRYKDILRATRSRIDETNIRWLSLLVIGFLIVTLSESALSFLKIVGAFLGYEFQHSSFNIYEMIGLEGYYFNFLLVVSLIFSSMRYFIYFDQVKPKDIDHVHGKVSSKILSPDVGIKIDTLM